jgi:anti-sigma regulatory factor (Ser/Thr protein kinase)
MGTEAVWFFDANQTSEAFMVRDAVAKMLAESSTAAEHTIAWLVATELIANVVRHAPGPGEVRLDIDDTRAVLHVLDSGPGYAVSAPALPEDLLSEGGRGLFIVSTLVAAFALRRRPMGGSHAIAVLA